MVSLLQISVNSIVADFMANRDPGDYLRSLDDVLLNYVTTEEYASLQLSERECVVWCVREIQQLISDLVLFKQKYCDPIQKGEKEKMTAMLITG